MDQQRFDQLTRRLSRSRSRRSVMKGLLAGITGGLIGASTGGVALAQGSPQSHVSRNERSVILRWIFCNLDHRNDPSWGFCAEQCVDLDVDANNCGACGTVCAPCEQCVAGQCVSTCDDNNACTSDICDHETGECRFEPIRCDDGNPCTVDICDPLEGCIHTPRNCDDGNPCTTDTCDTNTGQCIHTPVDCGYLECQGGQCV